MKFKEYFAKSLAEVLVALGSMAVIVVVIAGVEKIRELRVKLEKRKEEKFVDATPEKDE